MGGQHPARPGQVWHAFAAPHEGSADLPHALLWPRGKTKFIRPDGSIGGSPGHGVVLIGMGEMCCEALRLSGLGMYWGRREQDTEIGVPSMGLTG